MDQDDSFSKNGCSKIQIATMMSATSQVRELLLPEILDQENDTRESILKRSTSGGTGVASLCPYAVAHGCHVIGINNKHDVKGASGQWWTWKVSLSPLQVTSVSSNDEGTIVVATTDGGTVSLLKGSDGEIIASRKVAATSFGAATSVAWVGKRALAQGKDALIIEPPPSEDERGQPDLVLVSNIDGNMFNDPDPDNVAKAARDMHVHAIHLDQDRDFRMITGVYRSICTIRFLATDREGKLLAYDFSLETSVVTKVATEIDLGLEDWTIDSNVPFLLQETGSNVYIVCSSFSSKDSAIVWLDINCMAEVCRFVLPQQSSRPNLFALTSVESFSSNSSLAVAFVARLTEGVKVMVVQVVVEETFGLTTVSRPHILFQIPSEMKTLVSADIAHMDDCCLAYACRYKLTGANGENALFEFLPSKSGTTIGELRHVLECCRFDDADYALSSHCAEDLSSDPYAFFHSSEIAFARLQHTLNNQRLQDFEILEETFRRVASGAASGNPRALNCLLKSSLLLSQSTQAMSSTKAAEALATLILVMKRVLGTLPSSSEKEVRDEIDKLDDRRRVYSFISNSEAAIAVAETASVNDTASPVTFYSFLIGNGHFDLAERLCLSNKNIDVEAFVIPFLEKTSGRPPSEYLSLLESVIIPSMSGRNDSLKSIAAWACHTADRLDEKNLTGLDLESAITLLETVDRAIKRFQVQLHESFAFYKPFTKRSTIRSRRTGRTLNASSGSNSADCPGFLLPNSSSERTVQESRTVSNPTILRLDRLGEGATKSHTREIFGIDDIKYDGSDTSVESKLGDARCLLQARTLGLARSAVTLDSFAEKGGIEFIAIELVRTFSMKAEDHESRKAKFDVELKPFCESNSLSYDDVLLQCVNNMCNAKPISDRSIEEAASIARCCVSLFAKCRTTLAVLRAALLVGFAPAWLSELARDAIGWSTFDSSLKSELEEATRLLLIDNIVLRYCDRGARELFRVDNPRHAVLLADYVTGHVHADCVVFDTLFLCDAFTHLSSVEVMSTLMQKSLQKGDSAHCLKLIGQLYEHDPELARTVLTLLVPFAERLLCESTSVESDQVEVAQVDTSVRRQRANFVAETMALICFHVLKEWKVDVKGWVIPLHGFGRGGVTIDCIAKDFNRIRRLQKEHDIYVSLRVLGSVQALIQIVYKLFGNVISLSRQESVDTVVHAAKRACYLLCASVNVEPDVLWAACGAIALSNNFECTCEKQLNYPFVRKVAFSCVKEFPLLSAAQLSLIYSIVRMGKNFETTDLSTALRCYMDAGSLARDWALRNATPTFLPQIVSTCNTLTTTAEIMTRMDEGFGEQLDYYRNNLQSQAWSGAKGNGNESFERPSVVHWSRMHLSWYIGDGLLLPPSYASSLVVKLLECSTQPSLCNQSRTLDTVRFLQQRGAYDMALQLLSRSSAALVSSDSLLHPSDSLLRGSKDECCIESITVFGEALQSLSERFLGGTASGITSGVVDSQRAVAFLLRLPIRQAFRIYKSVLPTSLKTQDYTRVLTLANIGRVAGSGDLYPQEYREKVQGWQRQVKFVNQCLQLSTHARWWAFFRAQNIDFDRTSDSINDTTEIFGKDLMESPSARALVDSLLISLHSCCAPEQVARVCMQFAKAFGIPDMVVTQKHVEYLLSPIAFESLSNVPNPKFSLGLTASEKIVRELMRRMKDPYQKLLTIRRSLLMLESCELSARDYERHALVLRLYHECLVLIVDSDVSLYDFDPAPLELELELIDRRRDALAILASVYRGEGSQPKPPFPKFFIPLPQDVFSPSRMPRCPNVLGMCADDNCFDPLKPLEETLGNSFDLGTAAGLAPLCVPLGLPQGYIHARALMARFQSSDETCFPSVDSDVLPTLERLRLALDRATLAEWCSTQYHDEDSKLKCVDLALDASLQASSELERGKASLAAYTAEDALETVRRLSEMKNNLSDRLRIKSILRSANIKNSRNLSNLLETMLDLFDVEARNDGFQAPEAILNFLLVNGSSLAAEASLDSLRGLSITQFREFCSIVRAACSAVSDHYSHLRPEQQAQYLAQKWLFHGDVVVSDGVCLGTKSIPCTSFIQEEAEDTVNFVMDLDDCSAKVGESQPPSGAYMLSSSLNMKADEEPSALNCTSARELSETACRRAALRVAFVLACFSTRVFDRTVTNDENESEWVNKKDAKKPKRTRLLATIESKRDSEEVRQINALGKELLRIVFAESGSEYKILFPGTMVEDLGRERTGPAHNPTTITFAMRHRALRAASILCPQESLESICRAENYLSEGLSLHDCVFGAFVAKEIEEMGLPLPHSDLNHLSTMHYPSYARSLWRHHRDYDRRRPKGRLLILLLEMSLRGDEVDHTFIQSIWDELELSKLPRTLLLSCERIYNHKFGPKENLSCADSVHTVAKLILSEFKEILVSDQESVHNDKLYSALDTLDRLGNLVVGLVSDKHRIRSFLDVLKEFITNVDDSSVRQGLEKVLVKTQRHSMTF